METSGRRTVTGLAFAAIIFAVVTSIGTITHGQTRTTSQTDETYTGSGSGTNGFCNFSSEVMATANQIRNLPRFIALEGGANYTLVSAYQSSGVGTAYIGGTTLPDGTVRWATTVYYPPSWSFWFMPFSTYCTRGGSWVGVPFILAEVALNPNGSFNLSSVTFDHSVFYPNGTAYTTSTR